MAALSNSLVFSRNPRIHISSGSAQCLGSPCLGNLSFSSNCQRKVQLSTSRKLLTVQASYRDDERPSSVSIFVGGFVLGGTIVGALTCVFASQINDALSGVDRKELMKKLPKFIYDEEKELEKKRKMLTEKIDQLNSALDNISENIQSQNAPKKSSSQV